MNKQMMFGGIRVVQNPLLDEYRPVIELSHKVELSPEVRDRVDKSLLGMFGKTANVFMTAEHIICHPNVVHQIKMAVYNHGY